MEKNNYSEEILLLKINYKGSFPSYYNVYKFFHDFYISFC